MALSSEHPAAVTASLAAFSADGPGGAAAAALRRQAIDRFAALGLPGRKTEAWRYTDLREVAGTAWQPAAAGRPLSASAAARLAEAPATDRLVFVNGVYRADLSDRAAAADGLAVLPLDDTLAAGDRAVMEDLTAALTAGEQPLLALNTAFLGGGLLLRVAPRAAVERPVNLVFLTDGATDAPVMCHPRVLVTVGPEASGAIVEHHLGGADGPTLSTPVVQVALGAGARLGHYKLQREGAGAVHLATTLVRLERDAHYDGFLLSVGGAIGRNEVVAEFAGPGGDCRLSGGYLGRGRQVLDTTTVVRHAVPDCRSRQVVKGVLDDRARGVFQGRIEVARDAQRTDGYQMNRALLLSRAAEIDAKPELEIFADDVKCSHGATVGELDAEAVFYLRSRGVGLAEARALLIEAFVLEVLEEIGEPAVRENFAEVVTAWLDDAAAPVALDAEKGAA